MNSRRITLIRLGERTTENNPKTTPKTTINENVYENVDDNDNENKNNISNVIIFLEKEKKENKERDYKGTTYLTTT